MRKEEIEESIRGIQQEKNGEGRNVNKKIRMRPSLEGSVEKRSIKVMQGEVNQEFVDWLDRSIGGTTYEPRDFQALALISDFGQCVKICSISKFKFILTFDTIEIVEEVLCNHEELDQWFIELKKWDK